MSSKALIKKAKDRLKFIDMARSIAILLMLEGHFVDETLVDSVRSLDNTGYYAWQFMRHYTAPIFLTVTGIVFVYLLLKKNDAGYFSHSRVRKGAKRVLELIFWGFVVQYNAFHVLECIAIGILVILLIYGLYKLIRFVPLWLYFFLAGATIFWLFPTVSKFTYGMTFVESTWYSGIEALHPRDPLVVMFPIVPFVGFTMFGAMIGSLIHDLKKYIRTFYFPLIFFLVGIVFFFASAEVLGTLDTTLESIFKGTDFTFAGSSRLYTKLGMVLILLSILITIDNIWGDKIKVNSLFLKIGQNTLTIYVVHMLLLYWLVHALGFQEDIRHNLTPWVAGIGAALFIVLFVFMIKYLEEIRKFLGVLIDYITKFLVFVLNRFNSWITGTEK